MNLREFISSALIEICHGVEDAILRRDQESITARISPAFIDPSDKTVDWSQLVEKVEFDLAISENTANEANGSSTIKVLSFGDLGAKGSHKREYGTTNRIKFSVPVLLPGQLTHPK